jgi:hypothetical protein
MRDRVRNVVGLTAAISVSFVIVTWAAITLTVTLNDNNQTRLEEERTNQNRDTCRRLWKRVVDAGGASPWSPKGTCTQAQACVAAGAVGGASCSGSQANDANARIFAATQNGRENFAELMIKDQLDFRKDVRTSASASRDAEDFCDWFELLPLTSGDNNNRTFECNKWNGQPATCDPLHCLAQ